MSINVKAITLPVLKNEEEYHRKAEVISGARKGQIIDYMMNISHYSPNFYDYEAYKKKEK